MISFVHALIARWRPPLELWQRGEREAAQFLARERGFRIIARNWRSSEDRRSELDIVCQDGPVLVFVEVKTRSARAKVRGFLAVNWRKRRALQRAALRYLHALPPSRRPRAIRFDVVEVETSWGEIVQINHLENLEIISRYVAGD